MDGYASDDADIIYRLTVFICREEDYFQKFYCWSIELLVLHSLFFLLVKVNENATFVEDGMDDDIEFDDYSEEEEDQAADIDAVSRYSFWYKDFA